MNALLYLEIKTTREMILAKHRKSQHDFKKEVFTFEQRTESRFLIEQRQEHR